MAKISEHFTSEEFICSCGCRQILINNDLIKLAENVRNHFNKPMHVHCVNRCLEKNRSIGSKDTSQHVLGTAMDAHIDGIDNQVIYDYIETQLINTGGVGIYPWGVHFDVRERKARWIG